MKKQFIRNSDGTITDPEKGLTWKDTTIVVGKSFEACAEAVAEIGEGFRMPTLREKFSIIDHSRHSPAIDTDFFKDIRTDYWYWTSTETAWNKSAVWVVHFDLGLVYDLRRNRRACVLAVRAGQ